MAFVSQNLGATGILAVAIGYNASGQPCASITTGLTGNCTMTNGADYGVITTNTHPSANPSPMSGAKMAYLLRHEFAHILGLAHSQTSSGQCLNPTVSVK